MIKKPGFAGNAIQQYKKHMDKTKYNFEEMGITNKMAEPRVTKIVVNIGVKEAIKDKGVVTRVTEQLAAITGQKPRINKARLSIANFKLREGDPVGFSVTLRGKRMNDFLTKLVNIVLPRVRDFHGVPGTAFDKKGNYTLGLSEQIVFPEIDYAKVDKIRGLEVTIVTNAGNVTIARQLLTNLGFPFKKNG